MCCFKNVEKKLENLEKFLKKRVATLYIHNDGKYFSKRLDVNQNC